MRDYRGRTIVITGAGSGIGQALALEFARRGAQLALSDRVETGLGDTMRQCQTLGATARSYQVDVADRTAIYDHADVVAADFGAVDVLINNAGVAVHGRIGETPDADLEWLMNVNFWGVVHGSRAFLPHLAATGHGQLANVSSIFGLISTPKDSIYNASKFAVRGFTESLQQELRLDRVPVSVSCIHPGGIKTNIATNARVGPGESADQVQRLFARAAVTSPQTAARTIIGGLARNRARILVGYDAYLIAALPRVLGPHYGRLVETGARLVGI
ncbi:SDR family NAD(P)-dependent oxidoreductase [Mycolicibacterium aubagnense]|uniref:Short chain dehydrogenase/reductase n=1 Tax=Mycolicibacterium aubagnense TaxID=319707 RepID=A0ABM7IKZ9_9MYCO|nr:SDR family NAD(P)-dependent oxidoreductase [Mycolicibacterium aubagnense]TLH65629.1 acetoin dehydrogenase [Mycolicibacterium aubagnense]WGI31214.1 SDR family NAD(P)-dependent oxidoreductase [Mycolicibacterium aubagnense]BBX87389.1 putative short chain dehydrogenase/reductase [Mycolicibacterium aubagnense]